MKHNFGIDQSRYQPFYDDHSVVLKEHGGTFAFSKATQGDYHTDPSLDEHIANGEAAGLNQGLYTWIDPERTGRQNADYFSRVIDQYKYKIKAIAGDHEQYWTWYSWSQCYYYRKIKPYQIEKLPKIQVYNCNAEFWDVMIPRWSPGLELIMYTAAWFLNGYQLGLDTRPPAGVHRWLASYINQEKIVENWDKFQNRMDALRGPDIPIGWERDKWDIWQFSSSILVPGMPNIDWNIVNVDSPLNLSICSSTETNPPVPVEPPPAQLSEIRYVNVSWLNVRRGPGTNFERVKAIRKNTKVTILEKSDSGWGRYKEGWIHLAYTRL